MIRKAWFGFCMLTLMSTLPTFAESHPFTAQDLVTMKRLGDPQVSPDGKTVVFVRRVTDLDEDRGRTDLWSIPPAGGDPIRLTRDPASDFNPRFSTDGKTLYFLSSRSGSIRGSPHLTWRASMLVSHGCLLPSQKATTRTVLRTHRARCRRVPRPEDRGRVALEEPQGFHVRWHDHLDARYTEQSRGLSAVEQANTRRWLSVGSYWSNLLAVVRSDPRFSRFGLLGKRPR